MRHSETEGPSYLRRVRALAIQTFPAGSADAPIATGRSDPCRKGPAPSQEPCLSTAHAYTRAPGSGLSCPACSQALGEQRATSERRGTSTTQFRRPRQHQSSCAKAWRRRIHRIPLPTFVTIAIHPSCGGGTSKKMRLICPARQPRDGAVDWHDGQLVRGAYAGIARRAIDGSHWPRTLIMDVDRESHGALRAPQESRPCPR
jgi:hypothetical protein